MAFKLLSSSMEHTIKLIHKAFVLFKHFQCKWITAVKTKIKYNNKAIYKLNKYTSV